MTIQWFPGHMAKANHMIQENIKYVDVVIELLDARIPRSSANPIIYNIIKKKPKVIILNKYDLAEPLIIKEWLRYYKNLDILAVAINATKNKGFKELNNLINIAASKKIKDFAKKNINHTTRVMILGIPNVGKSSLINTMIGKAVTSTGGKPGITRGMQWIKIKNNIEILDSPGILWPKFHDITTGYRLAITGAINDNICDIDDLVYYLLKILILEYPNRLINRYNLKSKLPENIKEILSQIALRYGCLKVGGSIDYEKVSWIVLHEFRSKKLGLFTLEKPY